jgi:putative copper export protein
VVLVAVPAAVRRAGPLLAAVVVLCLVLPALGGHAASADAPALAAVIGSLHLLAAGLWIGTIGVLAVRWRADRPLLGEFSQVAVVAAPLVVLTGLAGAWSQVDAVAQLWTSAYGQLLVVKAVFAAVLLLLGDALVIAGHEEQWAGAPHLAPRLVAAHGIKRFRRAKYPQVMKRACGTFAKRRLLREPLHLRPRAIKAARKRE